MYQVLIFAYSLALGLVLGFSYDIFRVLRIIINSKNIAVFLQDVLYFMVSGILTFLFVLAVNSGEARLYILAGEAVGWILYHVTLGEFIYKCSGKMVSWAKTKIFCLKEKIKGKISKKQ